MSNNISVRKLREFTGHSGAVYTLQPGANAHEILSCGSDRVVAVWNLHTGEATAIAKTPGPIFAMRHLPEQKMLLLALENGDLLFNDIARRETVRRIQLHKKAIFDILPLPDGEHFLASSADGALSLWNIARREHLHYQKISSSSVRTLCLSPDKKEVWAGSSDHHIYRFDLGLNELQRWKAHENSVFRIAISPNGKSLISTGRDAHIKKWNASEFTLGRSVPAHMYTVNDLIFPDTDRYFFSGSMDKSIKLWQTSDLKLMKVCSHDKNECHFNGVNRLLWQSEKLYSCSDDRKIIEWEWQW